MSDSVERLYARIEKAKGKGLIPGGSKATRERIVAADGKSWKNRSRRVAIAESYLERRRKGGTTGNGLRWVRRTGSYK